MEGSILLLMGQYIPGFSFKDPNATKIGAPREWTNEQLCQLYADIEFLKRKTGLSVRALCKTLARRQGYAQRWGRYRRDALRKAYAESVKRRKNLAFELDLCGPFVFMPAKKIDRTSAAIERHSLRI